MDAKLGGLGWIDFLILHALANAVDGRMRRVDLADAIGITASGITRLLLPMEKIGLVRREAHDGDARVSYVVIARGGETKYREALERAQEYFADIVHPSEAEELGRSSELMRKLAHRML